MSPKLLGILLWFATPMLGSAFLALTDWSLLRPPRFVGLSNFAQLLQDELVLQALKVTTLFTLLSVPSRLVLAFFSAMLLNARRSRTMYGFRVAYYMPSLVPPVANAVLWSWLLNSEFGLINWALRSVGLPKVLWLQDTRVALPAIVLMSLWGFGSAMVIFLAGLQGIPAELYEAARIDGAGPWGCLQHITVPLMAPVILFNLIVGMIGSFQVFAAGYLITGGGPRYATLFYVLYLYNNAFQYLKMGYASAMAWLLFFIILALNLIVLRYSERSVYYAGSPT